MSKSIRNKSTFLSRSAKTTVLQAFFHTIPILCEVNSGNWSGNKNTTRTLSQLLTFGQKRIELCAAYLPFYLMEKTAKVKRILVPSSLF